MPPLAERVEQAVAAAVAARNGELEQVVREFVRQAVDAELERLVELELAAELDQRSNGAGDDGPARADTAAEVSARELERPARLCSDCGREPVLEGRRIGRACKTARDRERVRRREAAADDDAEDRPAGIAPYLLAARANHRGGPRLSPDELAAWLVDGGLATLDAGELRPTPRGLELGAGLHHLEHGA